jgi:hypothetical protein
MKRREERGKELIFIDKQWKTINQEQLENQLKLWVNAYDQKDIILAIAMKDFSLNWKKQ